MSQNLRYFENLYALLSPDRTFLESTIKLKKKAFKIFFYQFFDYLPLARLSRSQMFDFKLFQPSPGPFYQKYVVPVGYGAALRARSHRPQIWRKKWDESISPAQNQVPQRPTPGSSLNCYWSKTNERIQPLFRSATWNHRPASVTSSGKPSNRPICTQEIFFQLRKSSHLLNIPNNSASKITLCFPGIMRGGAPLSSPHLLAEVFSLCPFTPRR